MNTVKTVLATVNLPSEVRRRARFLLAVCVTGLFALPLAATTYWVDGANGNDGNEGTSRAEAFQTIQRAFDIEADNPGDDEIIICSGEYSLTEAIHLNAYCVVRGETGDPADVIIRRSGTVEAARFAGNEGTKLGKKLLVTGLTFRDDRTKLDSDSNTVSISTDAVVSNCVFCGCGVAEEPVKYCAVQVGNAARLTCSVISNCVSSGNCSAVLISGTGAVDQCLVTDCHTPSVAGGAVEGNDGGYLVDSVVSNCTGRLGSAFYGRAFAISNSLITANTVAFTSSGRLSGTLYLSALKPDKEARMEIVGCRIVSNTVSGASCGGVYANDLPHGLLIRDCDISWNETEGNYGGFYGIVSDVVLEDCRIVGNVTPFLGGGAAGTFTMRNCTVEGNSAKTGGGICVLTNGTATATITGSRILSNTASGSGGGIAIGGTYAKGEATANVGWALIEDCLISNNVANAASANDAGGGGIWFKAESLSAGLVSCCRIVDNTATSAHGGGVFVRGLSTDDKRGSIDIRSCFFKGNSALKNGGAINAISYPALNVDNCTLAGNTAGGNGKGIYIRWTGVKVSNSILSNDWYYDSSTPKAFYSCCIWPETAGVATYAPVAQGNVNVDPLFADAANGDYSLAANSPCVDTGVLLDWMDMSSRDIAGNRRVWIKGSGRPDIGAWELKTPVGTLLLLR